MRRYESMTWSTTRRMAVLGAAATLFALPLVASQVRPVNLEQMTERAAIIFAGRCVELRTETDPQLGSEVTIAVFEVERSSKGALDDRIEVKLLGDRRATPGVGTPAGFAQFRVGEEVVLFLYGRSSLGLTSPVGLGQGLFVVDEDKQGRRIAVNQFGNRNLLSGLSAEAVARLGSTVQQVRPRQGVDPDVLLDMAESLER